MNKILKNVIYLYRWLSIKRKIQFYLVVLFSIFVSALEMITVGAVVPFVSSIIDSDFTFASSLVSFFEEKFQLANKNELLLFMVSLFIFFAFMAGIARILLIYLISRFSNVILAEIGVAIYDKKLNETFLEFISQSSDKIIGLISSKLIQVHNLISGIMLLLTSSILLISLITALLFIDLKLTLVSFCVFGVLYLIVVLNFRKTLLKNSEIISQNQTKMVKSMQEGVGSIRDIILDANQKFHVNNFSRLIFERGFKIAINDLLSQSPRFLIETSGILLISLFLFFFSNSGRDALALFPILSALALGAQKIMPLMNIIFLNYATVLANSHQLNEAIEEIEKKKIEITSLKNSKTLLFENKIKLKNLYFKYNQNLPFVLNNINLEIIKGSKIGIIGHTGAGKSTFLDILMGLLPPTSGQYYIDDQLLNNINLNLWRKKITHVPQEIYLTNNTILENIAFGVEKEKIDISRVEDCAKKSEIFEYIQSTPKKFYENVGERGIWLSGGQKQRIGIARALYRKSELIILDEATNALDIDTENKIINSISALKNITIILVTHRNESLKICDQIYEIDSGGIKKK